MTFTVDHITDKWRQAQTDGLRRRSIQAGWTEEKVKALKIMIDQRGLLLSAGDIAKQLGISRNCVIGKARRMGWILPLASRTSYRTLREPKPRKPRPPRPKISRVQQAIKQAPTILRGYVPPLEQQCTLFDLTPLSCRYPMWPDQGECPLDPMFCGGISIDEDHPYCAAHARLVYQPPSKNAPTRKNRISSSDRVMRPNY